MKQYKIGVFFEKGYLVSSQINLVTEDYKSTEFIFEFDIEEGRKVFELKKPDGSKYIKDIINNKITLVDYDTELNEISLIPIAGTYEFEIVNYTEDSKLTLQEHGHFEVRGEIVEVNDSEVEKDTRLPILDSLINDVEGLKTDINSSVENATEQANYAKQQGDYAKEQAQIIIDANTTATKIINDFETNVNKYTKDFNANAESKENSYNENASNKLKEYNDNATTKLSEYNSNSETKTTAFDTNASEKTDAFNLGVTSKTTDFNSNAEVKTTEFNDNATTKTEEYNANAEAKVNEFNTTVDELKQDVEDCYNNMLTNEVEGTSIHIEDSANARILALESEGNCEQVNTKGTSLLDFANPYTIINSELSFENDVLTLTTATTKTYDGVRYNILDLIKANVGKTLRLDFESISETNTLSGTAIGSLALAVNGTNIYHTFIGNSSANYVPAIAYYTIPEDVSGITSAVLNIFTNNSSSRPDVSNKVVIKKPILHFGKEKVDYEPYTGGQASPSPDYSQEVEVLEGYNLFDKDNANILNAYVNKTDSVIKTSTTSKTLYIPCLPNETYIVSRISGTRFNVATTTDTPQAETTIYDTKENPTSDKLSITTNKNAKYLVVYYYNSASDTLTEQEILNSIQIIKGKAEKPYAPYGYIINKFVGKNLFDVENLSFENAYYDSAGNKKGSSLNGLFDFIDVLPSTEHTLSFKKNIYSFTIVEFDKNKNFIKRTQISNNSKTTITTSSTTKYVRLFFNYDNSTQVTREITKELEPQLELGLSTAFEPYQENNLDINLQGNFMAKIGDIADTLRVENGRAILTKRISEKIFDGTEVWDAYNNETINTTRGFLTAISDIQKSTYGIQNVICNKFKFDNTWGTDIEACNNQGTSFIVRVKLDRLTDNSITGFKAYLTEQYANGTPLKAKYILAEPYEVDLGPVKMPKTYEGITNMCLISNLESNMKLKYIRSTNIVVENLAKAIVAMGGEINV